MQLAQYLTKINSKLEELFPSSSNLHEAARYAVNSPGKRLRPILTLTTVEALRGDQEQALLPACAIELIHTYSMIHDDLPCMDNDDFRRGKPTLHKVYPESIAVLTGDFLLTHAFEIIAEAPKLSDQQKIKLISILSKAAGGEGMIAGQVMDMEAENRTISLEELKHIHQKKTSDLISASITFGTIIAEASPTQSHHLNEYGKRIGLAFQIIDDILDVTQSQLKHGKAIGSDQVNNKSTYVNLLGVDKAKEIANQLTQEAKEQLAALQNDTSLLDEIATYSLSRINDNH